jgi:hypothetical protein
MKCPICKRDVEETTPQGERNRFHPFCCERCKLIDLGRWLGGKYQIPVRPDERDDVPADLSHPSTLDDDDS